MWQPDSLLSRATRTFIVEAVQAGKRRHRHLRHTARFPWYQTANLCFSKHAMALTLEFGHIGEHQETSWQPQSHIPAPHSPHPTHDPSDSTVPGASPEQPGGAGRAVLSSFVGTAIEWYDFFIYGTAAALVLGPQFFPGASDLAGTLAAFATLAVGFVARPIGGVVMGHFGDRIGRKSMLVVSLMLMGCATVGIGLLPNYAAIGVWAPILLVALAVRPGPRRRRRVGRRGADGHRTRPGGQARACTAAAPQIGVPAGVILANVVFLPCRSCMADEQFSSWGWRVPFLLSAVLVRRRDVDPPRRRWKSPAFDGVAKESDTTRSPCRSSRCSPDTGGQCCSPAARSSPPTASPTSFMVYVLNYGTTELGYSRSHDALPADRSLPALDGGHGRVSATSPTSLGRRTRLRERRSSPCCWPRPSSSR